LCCVPELPCPNCGSQLSFVDQYRRHYCYRCGQYAPEGYGDRGAKRCPTCGGVLSFVADYNRLYCHRCNIYPAVEPDPVKAPEPSPSAVPTPDSNPFAGVDSIEAEPAEPAKQDAHPPAVLAQPTPAPSTPALPAVSSVPAPASVAAEPAPVAEPAEATPEEPVKPPAMKPAVLRVKLFSMKKSELIDICKSYDLEPNGTKDQLQERLLSYLKDLESEETEPDEGVPQTMDRQPEELPRETRSEPATTRAVPPQPAISAVAATLMIQEPAPQREAAKVVVEVPVRPTAQPFGTSPTIQVAPPTVPVSRPDHPCPTCGRELTYISHYSRWYCYSCQRYAPAAKARHACPTCGSTMRWIDRYQRWWCDECGKYASADFPGPTATRPTVEGASVVGVPVAASAAASVRGIVVHHHASPSTGIGLLVFGVFLYIVYAFFAYLGPAIGAAPSPSVTGDVSAVLQFSAFLLLAAGTILGLWAVRHRE
jgi:ribosomal protein S27AE